MSNYVPGLKTDVLARLDALVRRSNARGWLELGVSAVDLRRDVAQGWPEPVPDDGQVDGDWMRVSSEFTERWVALSERSDDDPGDLLLKVLDVYESSLRTHDSIRGHAVEKERV